METSSLSFLENGFLKFETSFLVDILNFLNMIWMHQGANSKRNGFEVGKAEAIQLLFSIICYQPKFVRLNPEYLSPIYRAIQQVMTTTKL